jgi:LacI family transcriptional regulator
MAGETATTHLLQIGCKTIAHIGGSDVSTAVDRQAGYSRTLARAGMSLSSEYVVTYGRGDNSGDSAGYNGMKKLLQLNPRPDGVFCLNDPVAMGAMRAVVEAGLRIPSDVAIVGCGNVHYDDLLVVPLTSVDQDSRNLGTSAARLAMSMIKRKGEGPPKSLIMPARLVVRASSRR